MADLASAPPTRCQPVSAPSPRARARFPTVHAKWRRAWFWRSGSPEIERYWRYRLKFIFTEINCRVTVLVGLETFIKLQYNKCGLGANACAGVGRACGGGWSGRGRCLAGDNGHAQAATKSLGSGAQALREYTCDTSPNRQTMHASGDRGARRRFQVL
eukprot:4610283-Pleurochrysis_carterae.AAC.1